MPIALPRCARCAITITERSCMNENAKTGADCPTVAYHETIQKSIALIRGTEQEFEFARQSSIQEGEGWVDGRPVMPRILETIAFAKKMNFTRLGLAFCIGLRNEAKVLEKLLTEKGFVVASASCKVGCVSKRELDLVGFQTVCGDAREAMCNPVAQALLLNDVKTDFNIVIGLCVGHDAMFFKYSDAPCTVLIAKDRVLGHNPAAALYTIDSYYQSLK